MKELSENLLHFINNNNAKAINHLVDIIFENKIDNLEELVDIENKYFTVNNKVVPIEERLNNSYNAFRGDIYKGDNLSSEDFIKYNKLFNELTKANTLEERVLYTIEILELLDYDNCYYAETYNLITSGLF